MYKRRKRENSDAGNDSEAGWQGSGEEERRR